MQPIYRQNQYRNTAVHQPGRVPSVNLPDPSFTKTMVDSAAAMVDHADALTDTLIDDIEYSTSLAENNRTNNIVNNTINEYNRRDQLEDGAPESWYDERGVFREQEFKNWQSSQLAQLSPSAAGYIRPESRQRAVQNTINTRDKLQQQLTARLATSIPARARKRLSTTLDQCTQRGDFAAATQLVSSAPSSIINDQDKAALIHDLTQQDIILSAKTHAASGNPEAFLNYYTSIIEQADRPTQLKLQSILNTVQPTAPKAGVSRRKDGTLTYQAEYPRLPYAVPDYVYDFYTHSGGQPAFKASPELRMQAMQRLQRFAAESIRSKDPIAIERVKQCVTLMGLDDSAANSIIQPLQKAYAEASEYNPAQTSAKLLTWRNYANASEHGELRTIDSSIAALTDQIAATTDQDDQADLQKELDATNTTLSKLRSSIEAREKEAEEQALAHYSLWRQANPKATKGECITKYYDLIDSYTAADYKSLKPYQQEINAAETAEANLEALRIQYGAQYTPEEYNTRLAILDASRKVQDAAEAAEAAEAKQQAPYTIECSSAWSTNLPDSNKEPILYLPADSTETRTTIPVRNGNTTIPARVSKTDKADTAILSNHLRLQLGCLGASGYNTILFADGQATLTHTPQADTMADTIINLEARRDKDGNIRQYKLPAADGGGTHEIAGINTKYHPQAYARIKKLLDSGKHQEAQQAISDYIIHYTQPASDLLIAQGINSAAAELMLRDIYFNMGPKGMQRVLSRAFPTGQITDFASEQDLIQRIYRARADYYAAIVRSKPQKAIFRNGWLNRNNKVLATAASLIK